MASLKTASSPKHDNQPQTLDRVTFGKRLRTTRKQLELTLAEVAQRSGVSITTISRAERGQLALSYEKFSALGRVLQMDMAAMFSQADAKTGHLDRPVITRAGAGVMYRGLAVSYEFLGTNALGKQMSPLLGTVHARSIKGSEDYARHEGEEFVHILSGAVEVHFEDGTVVRLARGDSLYFDSRIGHAYISISRRLCKVIAACTSESSFTKFARESAALEAGRPAASRPRKIAPGAPGQSKQVGKRR